MSKEEYSIVELVMGVVEKGFEHFDLTPHSKTVLTNRQEHNKISLEIVGHPFQYTLEKIVDEEIGVLKCIISCYDENPIYRITTYSLDYGMVDILEEVLYYREITFKHFIRTDLEQVLQTLMKLIVKCSSVLDKPKDLTIQLQNGDI